MSLPSIRKSFTIGFVVCLLLLAGAGYLQIAQGLKPCPLCEIQRLLMAVLGLVFVFAALHNPGRRGVNIYSWVIFFMALLGALSAGRQLWLQFYPPVDGVSCQASLAYMLQILPLTESIKLLIMGTGDCAEVQWHFLGLTMPGWTLISFAVLGLWGFAQRFRQQT
tara:strand:- start:10290 stop:10784 length:495 start_codon:yes stop_codon:yes gene_type:complete